MQGEGVCCRRFWGEVSLQAISCGGHVTNTPKDGMLKLDGSVAVGLPCHFAEAVQIELPDEGRKVGVVVVSASTRFRLRCASRS